MRKPPRPTRPVAFEPDPREQFRIATFEDPRGPWRDSFLEALWDAIELGLAAWDGERGEYYLAVPVRMERRERPKAAPNK